MRHHQAVTPKLDAIRAGVVAGIARAPAPETVSWREIARSLRWHLAGLGAAWVVVGILNMDLSPGAVAMVPREKTPPPHQIWASLRERRRLLQEYSDAPVVETPLAPGRRSEIKPAQMEV
ncbi:MAG: hypothetical protein ABSA47_07620 [Verrucomicrobiota bacterium]